MDRNIDPKKQLHLNFGGLGGGGGYNNDRNYTPTNERVFPTTPSNFPHSVFPSGQAANDYIGAQIQSPYGGPNGSYFPSGGYQAQYSQPQTSYQQPNQYQYQPQPQYQQPNVLAPQPSYQQQRQTGYNANDPTSGLARQFSNQNLGTSQRQGSPFARQQSPSSRVHPNGQQNQGQLARNQHSFTSNLSNNSATVTPSMSNGSLSASSPYGAPHEEQPPEKNPEKYSSNVAKRGQGLHALVESFFKENISRARDRNVR